MHMNWLDDSQIEELVNFDAFEDQELFEVLDDDEKVLSTSISTPTTITDSYYTQTND